MVGLVECIYAKECSHIFETQLIDTLMINSYLFDDTRVKRQIKRELNSAIKEKTYNEKRIDKQVLRALKQVYPYFSDERVAKEQVQVKANSKKEAKEEFLEKQEEAKRVVLVKKMPVYDSEDIFKNKEEEPKMELSKGDVVLIEEKGTTYSLVKSMTENITGYVWNDCIGELSEEMETSSKVIVIDVAYQEDVEDEAEQMEVDIDEMEDESEQIELDVDEIEDEKEVETIFDIAFQLEEKLEKQGYFVLRVQHEFDEDEDRSNFEGVILANQIKADILVTLQGNVIHNSDIVSIYENKSYAITDIYTDSISEECVSLKNYVLDSINANSETELSGSSEVIRYSEIEIPFIILELNYLDNISDDNMDIVNSIADGIENYLCNE